MTQTKFKLRDTVKLKMSEEHGEVIGVCIYVDNETNYLVRYKAGDNRQTESFWGESAIEHKTAIAA